MLRISHEGLAGLAGVCLLLSCQSQPDQSKTSASVSSECYAYTSARDTIRLELLSNGDIVTGKLRYQLAEKDRNTGTLRGQMHGDTLLADYTFQSEGVESVREVAFLKRANGLIEGFGPVDERGGKQVFNNHSALTFTEKMTLTPANCLP